MTERLQYNGHDASMAIWPEQDPDYEIKIAHSLDEMLQVFAIRSIIYAGEQECPIEEEFDGNDFAGASHFMVYHEGKLIGTARMRWFAEFSKFERMSILKPYRNSGAATQLVRAAYELASRKGYRFMLGQVETPVLRFWERMGGAKRADRGMFYFSDREYHEGLVGFELRDDRIGLQSDSMTLNRPEGEWDESGVLDASIRRGNSKKFVGPENARLSTANFAEKQSSRKAS